MFKRIQKSIRSIEDEKEFEVDSDIDNEEKVEDNVEILEKHCRLCNVKLGDTDKAIHLHMNSSVHISPLKYLIKAFFVVSSSQSQNFQVSTQYFQKENQKGIICYNQRQKKQTQQNEIFQSCVQFLKQKKDREFEEGWLKLQNLD